MFKCKFYYSNLSCYFFLYQPYWSLSLELRHYCAKLTLVCDKHVAWLAAMSSSNYASLLELVHKTSGTIVSDRESALNHTGAALLTDDNRACSLFEEVVEVAHVASIRARTRIATILALGSGSSIG